METFLLIAALAAAWFWFDSVTAREAAIRSGRELAERCSMQLLDETVACSKLWLARNNRGHMQLMRTYMFEVSTSGSNRLPCHLVMLGRHLQSWHIPPYLVH